MDWETDDDREYHIRLDWDKITEHFLEHIEGRMREPKSKSAPEEKPVPMTADEIKDFIRELIGGDDTNLDRYVVELGYYEFGVLQRDMREWKEKFEPDPPRLTHIWEMPIQLMRVSSWIGVHQKK